MGRWLGVWRRGSIRFEAGGWGGLCLNVSVSVCGLGMRGRDGTMCTGLGFGA